MKGLRFVEALSAVLFSWVIEMFICQIILMWNFGSSNLSCNLVDRMLYASLEIKGLWIVFWRSKHSWYLMLPYLVGFDNYMVARIPLAS